METKIELITIKELAERLKCSESHIYFQIAERRAGRGNFPSPIHGYRKRCLWLAEEVDNYIRRLNAEANPAPQAPARKHSKKTIDTLAQFGITIPQ